MLKCCAFTMVPILPPFCILFNDLFLFCVCSVWNRSFFSCQCIQITFLSLKWYQHNIALIMFPMSFVVKRNLAGILIEKDSVGYVSVCALPRQTEATNAMPCVEKRCTKNRWFSFSNHWRCFAILYYSPFFQAQTERVTLYYVRHAHMHVCAYDRPFYAACTCVCVETLAFASVRCVCSCIGILSCIFAAKQNDERLQNKHQNVCVRVHCIVSMVMLLLYLCFPTHQLR